MSRPAPAAEPRGRAAWAFALLFFALGSQYLLRPVRDAMGLAGHVKELPRLFTWTWLGTLVLAPLVALAARRMPRRRLLRVFYRIAALALLLFVLRMGPEPEPAWARGFFVAASVTNLFFVSLAWSLIVDVFPREQGARLFGFIAGGGTLGAFVGSLFSAAFAERLGPRTLLVLAAAFLELAALVATRLDAGAPAQNGAHRSDASRERVPAWRTLSILAQDRYVLAIALYMLLYTTTSTFLYLDQARIVNAAVPDLGARAALFARIDFAVNSVSLLVQAFATRAVLTRLGPGVALAVLPVVTLLGFSVLRAAPTLAVIVVFQVARRAVDYGVTRPARELLFTMGAPNEKYEAKSFVDTFVYRGGDAMAASVFPALAPTLGPAVLLVSAPLCVMWAWVALKLPRIKRTA